MPSHYGHSKDKLKMKKKKKKGNAELAAMTPPFNKVTRGDVIKAAKKRSK
tara:strand:- start:783 stop:932 length:150 start_codon:yes stop_codon:yes gene_type:complete